MSSDDNNAARNIEERLYANETRPDKTSHLEISDPGRCPGCDKPCTVVCPARTYTWSDEQGCIIINFENCLECGGCRGFCTYSVIEWKNPRGGAGICYRYG